MNKTLKKLIALLVVILVALSALTMVIGTDTNWGKTEVTRLTLLSADGDEISAMLYKPKTATPETPAPCVMFCHGGNDMLEQGGTYALELARRGYVVMTWDYSGCARSDIATGPSETAPDPVSGNATMGAETVWNTIKTFDFVDFSKIVASGHSMGGVYTMGFSIRHQEEVFLQVNLGMNNYGSAENQSHNFNFVNILGIADESLLARTDNNVMSAFDAEQIKRVFYGDYTSDASALPAIEIGKVYTAMGTNGKEYTRTAYMPDSCHAYYLVTNDAVQTMIYAITSQVGLGLDEGVNSYADHGKISTVWQVKDIGFALIYLCVAAIMFLAASLLLELPVFQQLKLKPVAAPGFKTKTAPWWVCLAVMVILPVALYRIGILASNNFLGIDISGLWLLGGTNNTYISWQWTVSIAFLVFFLLFHFLYGRKNGGNLRTYGFATSDEDGFHPVYVLKSLALGAAIVGIGYGFFAILSAYTQQGIHIATFMLNTLKTNRTLCVVMYFLFQIPYFLTSSMAMKTLSIDKIGEGKKGSTIKAVAATTAISMGGLFLLWLGFILMVTQGHTLTSLSYFMQDRMYIYTIAILPLVLGMAVANALNIYVSKKTNSIWAGLFTALLFGAWIITSCGGMAKYVY